MSLSRQPHQAGFSLANRGPLPSEGSPIMGTILIAAAIAVGCIIFAIVCEAIGARS